VVSAFAALLILAGSCGRVPTSGDISSPSPTESSEPLTSPSATPSSNPDAFQPWDCSYPSSGGTRVSPIGTQGPYFSVGAQAMYFTIPAGWTQEALDPGFHYTPNNPAPYAILDAPASYGFAPTHITLVRAPSVWEPFTPDTAAPQAAAEQFSAQVTNAGGTVPCTVNGDTAAFFATHYVSPRLGDRTGTWVVWLHQGLVYVLSVEGGGGTSASAIHDAKEILSSVTWGSASLSSSPVSSP